MGREIERKFCVLHDGWRANVVRASRIEQAYIGRTPQLSTRVRIRDDVDATLTIKSAAKELDRAEFEYAIPARDARELIALANASVLVKIRHDVMLEGLKWELDVFGGRHTGLTIAELELPSVDHALNLPDWIGEEVTGDPKFYNEYLAEAGDQQVLSRGD